MVLVKSVPGKSLSKKSRSKKSRSKNSFSKSYVILIPLVLLGAFMGLSWIRNLNSKPSSEVEAVDPSQVKARERAEKSQYRIQVDKTTQARAIALAGTDPSEYLLKGLATAGRARSLNFQADSPKEWAQVEKLWLDAYALVQQVPYDHPDGDKAAAMADDFFNLAFQASKKHP